MHKLHACSLLLGSSDQPDERLYQVFVSCPLFCDRQYLLLKFRRNEALCCLIGFGLGVSCCLVYRWLRGSLLCLNQHLIVHSAEPQVTPPARTTARTTADSTSSGLLTLSASCYSFNSLASKQSQRPSKSIKASPPSRGLPNNSQNNNNHTNSSHSLRSASTIQRRSQRGLDLNDEPLNDVYQNLSKFLGREFCKSIRLRRPSKRPYAKERTPDFFPRPTDPSHQSKAKPRSRQSAPALTAHSPSPQPSPNRFLKSKSEQPVHFNFTTGLTNTSTRTSTNTRTNTRTNTTKPFSAVSPKQQQLFPDLPHSLTQNSLLTNVNNDSFSIEEDNMSNTSNEASTPPSEPSTFDFEDITGSRCLFSRSEVNSVDQTLDEALNQISQLKEDMTGLCEDLDTLYHTKQEAQLTERPDSANSAESALSCLCHYSGLDASSMDCASPQASGASRKPSHVDTVAAGNCLRSANNSSHRSCSRAGSSLISNGCKRKRQRSLA